MEDLDDDTCPHCGARLGEPCALELYDDEGLPLFDDLPCAKEQTRETDSDLRAGLRDQ